MEKAVVIFDLDGTLVDSSSDIAWAANRVLERFGHGVLDEEKIKECIGWGVRPLFESLMKGESAGTIERARLEFLDIYGGRLLVDTALYPGVTATLDAMAEAGKRMAVVTNKPAALTARIVEGLDLSRFFPLVLGGDSLPNKKPHPEPILKVLDTFGAAAREAVFVGDSAVDCRAARAAGTAFIGAAYGFRGRRELEEAGCDAVIDTFPRFLSIVR